VTPMRGRNVMSISFAQDNSVWVGTDNGLFKLNPYNGAVLGQAGSLPSNNILSLSPDTGNKLWVGTMEGLAWISLTSGRVRPHYAFVKEPPENF
ncbi:MAG: transcriptional regulator, partial [Symploca sp. SIO2E6]|nr:transcriptional regulator [Symploca sp. SIO2E6]